MIAAEGEQKASHALRDAAEIISQSPSAIQLRYLQVIINYFWFSCFLALIVVYFDQRLGAAHFKC